MLKVYDLLGRGVAVLAEGAFDAGYHTVEWDGRDGAGRALPSGVYLYTISAGPYSQTRRMTIAR